MAYTPTTWLDRAVQYARRFYVRGNGGSDKNLLPPFNEGWTLHENTRMKQANFNGKVSGSTTANPHLSSAGYAVSLIAPNGSWANMEQSQTNYNNIATSDGTLRTVSTLTNLEMAQQVFKFNLIEHVSRTHGVDFGGAVDTAGKVAWLKANITKLTGNWHGYGSGPSGNMATFTMWGTAGNYASSGSAHESHSLGTVLKLPVFTTSVSGFIDNNGFVHFLAYADASNGTTASTINTDFVELEVYMAAGSVPQADYSLTLTATNASQHNDITLTCLPSTTYTLSCTHNGYMNLYSYDEADNLLTSGSVTTGGTVSLLTGSAATKIKARLTSHSITSGTLTFTNPQLEKGSAATLFAPKGGNAVYNDAPASLTGNFAGKVAGSLVENPHYIKYTTAPTALYATPAAATIEAGTASYTDMSTLNGTPFSRATSTNTAIAAVVFSFDVAAILERNGFKIPSTDKVAWLKANVTKLTFNWHGLGSGPSGNLATIRRWVVDSASWNTFSQTSNSTGSVAKLTLMSDTTANRLIDANGFAHLIAYAEASNGTVQSYLGTDYAELLVEFQYRVNRAAFDDYTPQPAASVEYYAQALGNNGTYAPSASAAITPGIAYTQLSSLSDTSKYATLKKGNKLQKSRAIDSAKMKFAGREYSMVEFGTSRDEAFDYSYLVFTWDELQIIEELAGSGETLLLRDSSGRKTYVAVDRVEYTENPTYWEISIKPEKVYYVEGV